MLRMIGAIVGAGAGGWVGHARLLCFDGQCPLTGSWWGGALIGGLLGLLLVDAFSRHKPG